MRFGCLYSHGTIRLAACVPGIEVGDPDVNFAETMRLAARGNEVGAAIMVFPELGLSAYAIDDLLYQDALLDAVETRIGELAQASGQLYPVLIVGAPLRRRGQLFNSAVIIHRGTILGVVPKTYLPNYREFYERRHFASGAGIRGSSIELAGRAAPFGIDLLFRSTTPIEITFHVEICENVWVPLPPSTSAALAGAEVLVNLSASNVTIGKAETRRLLCASQSARTIAAYIYSAAGPGESTTDLAWDGHAAIFEYGDRLAETARFPTDSVLITADVDLERLRQDRMRVNTFSTACARRPRARALPPPS
jgi:NAD+ synthase (glutamine-hydrolysing)